MLGISAGQNKALLHPRRNDVRHGQPKFPSAARRYPGQANEGGSDRNRQPGGRVLRRPSHRDLTAQDGERGTEEEMLFARSAAESGEGGSRLPGARQQRQSPADRR